MEGGPEEQTRGATETVVVDKSTAATCPNESQGWDQYGHQSLATPMIRSCTT